MKKRSTRQTNRPHAAIGAGLIAGTAGCLCELLAVPFLPDGPGFSWSGAMGATLCLPFLFATGGLLLAWLPDGVRSSMVAMVCGWWIGDRAALGRHAATLPLAEHWNGILAALLAAANIFRFLRSARRPRAAAVAGALVAPPLFVLAAIVQRGRYEGLREAVATSCVILFWPLAGLLVKDPRPKRAAMAYALSGLVAFGSAAALLGSGPAADFAFEKGTLSGALVRRIRAAFLDELEPGSVAVVLSPYFGSEIERESSRRLDEEGARPDGIIFITIDAMRGDMLGRKVGGRPVTPFLDSLGDRGIVFERAYAPAPGTHLSFFGFLSGFYPTQYLSHPEGFNGVPLITERLEEAGVATVGSYPFKGLTLMPETMGRRGLGFGRTSSHDWADPPLDRTFALLLPREGRRKFFSFWHQMLPHYPYDEGDPAFRAGRSPFELYAAEIREADDRIRRLYEELERRGLAERTWIIVAADHGEEFEEHGALHHGTQLFDESVRVPLVAFGKGIRPARCGKPVSLVDLAPTLDQVFALPDEGRRPRYAGRSWLPLFLGMADPDREPGVLVENPPIGVGTWNTGCALVLGDRKLIVDERTRRARLFDLRVDPGEEEDRASSSLDVVESMHAHLLGLRQATGFGSVATAPIEDLDSMFRRAEDRGAGEVFGLLRLVTDPPRGSILRAMAYLADHPDLPAREELIKRYSGHGDPELALGARLLGAVDGRLESAEARDLMGRLRRAGDRNLRIAAIDLARIYRFQMLPHEFVSPSDPDEGLTARLATAEWRAAMEGVASPLSVVEDGLKNASAWHRLRALRLLRQGAPVALLDRLLQVQAEAEERELKVECVRAIGSIDDPRSLDFLRGRLESGDRREREVAFAVLAVRGSRMEGLTRLSFLEPDMADRTQGLGEAEGLFRRFVDAEVRVTNEWPPEGSLAALFVDFPAGGGTRIEVAIGEAATELLYPPVTPGLPLLVELPAAAAGQPLRLRVSRGSPREVLAAGLLIWAKTASTRALEPD